MIGAALDHHIAGLELDGGVIHVHVELALHYDHIVDGLGAVHAAGIAGRKGDHREAGAIDGRRRAENTRAEILDVLSDRHLRRRPFGDPDQRRLRARGAALMVGRLAVHDHLGDVVVVMAGHHPADRRIFRSFCSHVCAFPCDVTLSMALTINRHPEVRAISAFTRVFDALWRASNG